MLRCAVGSVCGAAAPGGHTPCSHVPRVTCHTCPCPAQRDGPPVPHLLGGRAALAGGARRAGSLGRSQPSQPARQREARAGAAGWAGLTYRC